jgi:hypothetical protein
MRVLSLRALAHGLAFVALGALPLRAQDSNDNAGSSWLQRVSISVRYGELRPMANSEVFALIDRALTPGSRSLRPRMINAELQYRVFDN